MTGQYFDNNNFTAPVLARIDPIINFNWWEASPAPGVEADTFSIRWTGDVMPLYSETYTFYTLADDGVRLWVNGQQLVNEWANGGARERSGTIALQAGQRYRIQIDYYDHVYWASMNLSWSSTRQPKQIIPQSQLYPTSGSTALPTATMIPTTATATRTATSTRTPSLTVTASRTPTVTITATLSATATGTLAPTATTQATHTPAPSDSGSGLTGAYFDNNNFTALVLTRIDPIINFNWWEASPAPGVDVDTFSIRWTGDVVPLYTETYTFYTVADDGVRLWVNNQLLVDDWNNGGARERSGTIALQAGQRYRIQIDYYDHVYWASMNLSWSSARQPKQIIPQNQLYPTSGVAAPVPTATSGIAITPSPTPSRTLTQTPAPSATSTIIPVPTIAGSSTRRVVGYVPCWSRNMGFTVSDIDLSVVTHVADFGGTTDVNGNLVFPVCSGAQLSSAFINGVHQGGGKILLVLGGANSGSAFASMSSSVASRSRFVQQVADTLTSYSYDGVDIDWEIPNNSIDRANLTTLVRELRSAIGTTRTLSVTVSPWHLYGGQWVDIETLHPLVDWFGVLTYDFHHPRSGHSSHNAPLYSPQHDLVHHDDPQPNIDAARRYYESRGVPLSKLYIGIPFYGWRMDGANDLGSLLANTGGAQMDYRDIAPLVGNGWQRYWDSIAQVPYLRGASFISYDDPQAIQAKCDYVRNNRIGGVVIWALHQDIPQTRPLINAARGCSAFGSAPTPLPTSTPMSTATPSNSAQGAGLTGEYFNNNNFTAPVVTRIDPIINFNWWEASPAPGIDVDTFSIRWTGDVVPLYSETYTFYTVADDGVRLWVNNQLLVDDWNNGGVRERSGTIALQAGQRYRIQIDYYDHVYWASMNLSWSSARQPKQIIPQNQLYPAVAQQSLLTSETSIEPLGTMNERQTQAEMLNEPITNAEPAFEATAVPTLPFSVGQMPIYDQMERENRDWEATTGWTLTGEAGWQAMALAHATEALAWRVDLNLQTSQRPLLSFQSRLATSHGSSAALQVRANNGAWDTRPIVSHGANWETVMVDLSGYRGQVINLRFVWLAMPSAQPNTSPDLWQINSLSITDAPAVPSPTVEILALAQIAPTLEPVPTTPAIEATAFFEPAQTPTPIPTSPPTEGPSATSVPTEAISTDISSETISEPISLESTEAIGS